MCETRAGILAGLERLVSGLDPGAMAGEQAKELVVWFSRVEHLAAAGTTLCAGRVASSGSFRDAGEKSAATWLATQTGDSVGGALRLLETAGQLQELPVLEEAFREGQLSPTQAFFAAGAAVADPSKEKDLLETAKTGSMRHLRREAERVRAAARSEEDATARYARVRAGRSLRWWTDFEGFFRLDARLTPDDGARLRAEIEPEAKRVFKQARNEGRREPFSAYVADALVKLVTAPHGTARASSHSAILRVDLAALRRGELGTGEVCEIPGVGPVPLPTARELLGDVFLKLVVLNGVDVQSVCHLGRHVSAFTKTALEERDPVCVVPGCEATSFLEADHWQESFAKGGPTDLVNLCRICSRHHHLKHTKGFSLRGGPGKWEWIAPKDTATRAKEPPEVHPWRARAGAG